MSYAKEIRSYILAETTGLLGVQVFISQMPAEAPDTAVSIIPSGGPGPLYTHKGNVAMTRPSFQVIVRSSGRERAHEVAKDIHDTLAAVTNMVLPTSSGSTYTSITPMQFPADMGVDALERPLVTCNYLVERPA